MTRRDIIIAAVIVNLGLLAVLFLLAGHFDETEEIQKEEIAEILLEKPRPILKEEHAPVFLAEENDADEVDAVLRDFAESIEAKHETERSFTLSRTEDDYKIEKKKPSENVTEITVKRGDVLSKIAKANGTTVSAIKKLNHLTSDRLQIGQTLQIPIASDKDIKRQETPSISQGEGSYYIVQSGDNPWKIAKKFDVSVNELLQMNNMDEKKARAIKPGDRIRVE